MKKILSMLLGLGILLSSSLNVFALRTIPTEEGCRVAKAPTISNISVTYGSNTTQIAFSIDMTSKVTVKIAENVNDAGIVRKTILDSTLTSGTWYASWDQKHDDGTSKNPNGKYFFLIDATNATNSACSSYTTQYVYYTYFTYTDSITVPDDNTGTISYLIKNLKIDTDEFDPYDDEEAEVTFDLVEDAIVDVKVYDDDNNDYVKGLEVKENLDSGDYDYQWDGTDNNDDIVDDGDYYIKVTAKASNGYTESKKVSVEVNQGGTKQTKEPRLQDLFITKDSFDPNRDEMVYVAFTVTADADIEAYIYDGNTKLRELYYKKNVQAGTYVVGWNGEDDDGDAVKEDKTYKYTIHVENDEGEDDASGNINIKDDSEATKYPNIYNDVTSPVIFVPQEDESMQFTFKLAKDAYTTVNIYDGGDVVATIFDDNADQGTNKVNWDGRDDDGDLLSDGVYDYKIISESSVGESKEWGKFMILDSYQYNYKKKCAGFIDVFEDSDYCQAIEWAVDNDIIDGNPDNSFKPNDVINRVGAIKVILKAFDFTILEADGTTLGFKDVDKGGWYMKYVRTAKKYGIIKGYEDGSFKPNSTLTKAEAAVMTLNAAEIKKDAIVPMCNKKPYYDVDLYKWYTDAACYIKDFELTDDDLYFLPNSLFTRGQMVELLYNFYKDDLL